MPINYVLTEITSKEGYNKELTRYLMFKYAIKTGLPGSIMKEERKFFEVQQKYKITKITYQHQLIIELNEVVKSNIKEIKKRKLYCKISYYLESDSHCNLGITSMYVSSRILDLLTYISYLFVLLMPDADLVDARQ